MSPPRVGRLTPGLGPSASRQRWAGDAESRRLLRVRVRVGVGVRVRG